MSLESPHASSLGKPGEQPAELYSQGPQPELPPIPATPPGTTVPGVLGHQKPLEGAGKEPALTDIGNLIISDSEVYLPTAQLGRLRLMGATGLGEDVLVNK